MRREVRISRFIGFAVIFFILLLVAASGPVRAENLGTKDLSSRAYSWNEQPVDSIRFDLTILHQEDTRNTIAYVTESDIGRTFTLTNGSPQFSALVSWLTNGSQDDLVLFTTTPYDSGPGELFSEASIQKLYNNGPDFAGCEIENISMTLNNFVLEYPVSVPDRPEWGPNWNYMEYDVTLSFNGVPEPGTILLLGLGATIVRKKAKNKTA